MAAPFRALIAGWTLIVVILSVAGYSYRWNYYYNFGLQSLVLAAPLGSLPVYAIEIVRNPASLAELLGVALLYLLPFHAMLLALGRARGARSARLRKTVRFIMRTLALDNRLLVEALAAALIILVAFRVGGDAGYHAYLRNVLESTSTLPKVTALAQSGSSESVLPITCNAPRLNKADPLVNPPYLGEPDVVESLLAGTACTTDQWSWRLLLRDEKFVYIFATVQNRTTRPQTLILPNNDTLTLILR